jgi:glutamate 5-kinase
MDCGSLFILSNIDGVYTGAPNQEGSELIRLIDSDFSSISKYISPEKSGFGRGGMLTKCTIASKIAAEGIHVYIANGTKPNILTNIIHNQKADFTRFVPHDKKATGVKKWLSHSRSFAKGAVYINQGALVALLAEKASSLLMIGVTQLEGFFEKGDIVAIYGPDNQMVGLGKTRYDSTSATELIGQKQSKPFIHYDYLVLNEVYQQPITQN